MTLDPNRICAFESDDIDLREATLGLPVPIDDFVDAASGPELLLRRRTQDLTGRGVGGSVGRGRWSGALVKALVKALVGALSARARR